MALISLLVRDVITEKFEVGKDEWGWNIYKPTGIYDLHLNKLLNTNTYMVVFNKPQEKLMQQFEEHVKDKLNILLKTKPAVNSNYRGTGPRNTLFIFEVKDDA